MQTKLTTVTKQCDGPDCKESLTIRDDQQMTEQLAIDLGMWLTVLSEIVTADGVQVHAKHFCGIECLASFVTPLVKEYKDAETKVLTKTPATDPAKKEQESWEQLRERLQSENQ